MDNPGLLLYGYSKEKADCIKQSFEKALNCDIIIINATNREDDPLNEILESGNNTGYADREHPVLMFLGFSDSEISLAIKSFPRSGDIPRPIFCGLTEQNYYWTFRKLHEHLIEEQRYWTKKEDLQKK
ncbi:MAG TPA: DUF3783 domain-containing protein [Spirochaetota bacterium]|nr:DUF3783 domain-containing protein [Spirochaetota bacterium]HPI90376.1 DUF3783 domain-containing protein [Spirochaetota bacterium]HPR47526.1 DUF3783 domain-containing protein [Spirochaetota bacterium]